MAPSNHSFHVEVSDTCHFLESPLHRGHLSKMPCQDIYIQRKIDLHPKKNSNPSIFQFRTQMTPIARLDTDERVSSWIFIFLFFISFFFYLLHVFPPRFGCFYFLIRFQKEETPKKKRDYTFTGQHGNSSIVKGRSLEGLGKTKILGKFLFLSLFFFLPFLFLDKAINLARALQPAKPLHGYSA